MILTTEDGVWLVEHVFREGDRYTDVVRQQFTKKFRDKLVLLYIATQFLILWISFAKQNQHMMPTLWNKFGNKRRRIQACIDAKRSHFQHNYS